VVVVGGVVSDRDRVEGLGPAEVLFLAAGVVSGKD